MSHLPDEQLLLEIDGELSARAARRVQNHCQACWRCRSRRSELESAITDFIRARRLEIDDRTPSGDLPRALLENRLKELSEAETTMDPGWFSGWLRPLRILGGTAFCVLAFGVWTNIRNSMPHPKTTTVSIPDSALTPGATLLVDQRQVCALKNVNNGPVDPELRKNVLEEYGITVDKPNDYEIDYLITPGLGGADDIHNLWPHSYSSTWNARVKDQLEQRLRDLVCSGSLDLEQAQKEIAQNWIGTYKKYFHTDQPLPMRAEASSRAETARTVILAHR